MAMAGNDSGEQRTDGILVGAGGSAGEAGLVGNTRNHAAREWFIQKSGARETRG